MFFTIIQLIADEIENLARIYGNMMNALAYRILQNHHSAEDAVQDALVSLSHNMNKLDSLHSKRSYNYIYTVHAKCGTDDNEKREKPECGRVY